MPTVHTQTLTTYAYSELSEKAKQNAITDADNKGILYPEDWSIDTITDFVGIAEAMGLAIPCGNNEEGVLFSANSCQGDGLSFIGEYNYRSDWKKALTNEFGGDLLKRFLPYALELQEIHEKINSRKGDITNHISLTNFVTGKDDMTLKVVIERDNHSRSLHDGTMDFENTYALKNGEQEFLHDIFLFDKYKEIHDSVEEVFRSMARNLHGLLVKEKEYFFKKEYFEETFLDAFPNTQFFEDGTLFVDDKKEQKTTAKTTCPSTELVTKFTKGPWEKCISSNVFGNGYIIAEPFTDGTSGPVLNKEEQDANAYLMAKSPEMYDLLTEITEFYKIQISNYEKNDQENLAQQLREKLAKIEIILSQARGEV